MSHHRFFHSLPGAALGGMLALGCSADTDAVPADTGPTGETVTALDVEVPVDIATSDDVAPDIAPSDGADSDVTDDVVIPPPVHGPVARGLVALRGALHVHNRFSHDACDGRVDEDPTAAPDCLADFRAQLCTSGLDFAFMTDHPSNMSGQPFEELLYHDAAAGDTLVRNAKSDPVANIIECPETLGGPARPVHLTVGFEGNFTMPLGLEAHLDPIELERVGLDDATPEADRKAVIDAIHAKGGLVAIAHSEREEIGADALATLPIDVMEQYNIHANFLTILEENITRVFDLEAFLKGAVDGPEADLAFLMMLDIFPDAAIQKWYQVSARRPITGVVGSDVHQNVVLDGYCTPGGEFEALCDSLAESYPVLVANLKAGGPLTLSDGKRIDSYERIFRWLHNRVYAKDSSAAAIKEGLALGRQISVFAIFGELDGLDFRAEHGDAAKATITELGGQLSLKGDAPTFVVTAAAKPRPAAWAQFLPEESDAAEVETHLIGIDETGTFLDVSIPTPAAGGSAVADLRVTPDKPGRYHVEVLIRPKHLIRVLRARSPLADLTFRWAITNPIYLKP